MSSFLQDVKSVLARTTIEMAMLGVRAVSSQTSPVLECARAHRATRLCVADHGAARAPFSTEAAF